jgi:hypothetical protein
MASRGTRCIFNAAPDTNEFSRITQASFELFVNRGTGVIARANCLGCRFTRNRLQLPQMINIVPRSRFNQRPENHFASLRVNHCF